MQLYGFAKLTDEQIKQVTAFEAETGKRLLVFRPFEVMPAFLSREQVERLRALEEQLGDIIVAIE
jgi:hypothetical protein